MKEKGTLRAYELIRSRRKTLALEVAEDGRLLARAPLRLPQRDIDRFVAQKAAWIAGRQAEAAERRRKRAAFVLRPGTAVRFRGRELPLASGGEEGFDGGTLWLPETVWQGGEAAVRAALAGWYRRQAEQELPPLAAQYAERTGWQPASVGITGARTRWGSCSGTNRIHFSWRLLMAPEEAIAYVVVHELAHTVEHHHSPRFWALVASVLPDWQERRGRLRETERLLREEGWLSP